MEFLNNSLQEGEELLQLGILNNTSIVYIKILPLLVKESRVDIGKKIQ